MNWLIRGLAMANGEGGTQDIVLLVVMMVIIFGIFYFLVIRPQKKQQEEHEQMVEQLKPGDRVVTAGGLHGKISNVGEETVKVQIAKDIKVTLNRESIATVKNGGGEGD